MVSFHLLYTKLNIYMKSLIFLVSYWGTQSAQTSLHNIIWQWRRG